MEIETEAEDTPPPRAPKKPPPRREEEPSSMAGSATAMDENKSLYEWLKSYGGGSFKIKLFRISPATTPDGQPCAGFLQEYDELFDEAEVARVHGGGKFQIKTFAPGKNGSGQVYAGAKTFSIGSVPPKIAGTRPPAEEKETIIVPPQSNDVTKAAMGMMADLTKDAQRRAGEAEHRAREGGQLDPAMIQLMTAPLQAQLQGLTATINQLQAQLVAKDAQITDLLTRKPESSFQDQLILKMHDTESNALQRQRDNHESEIRQLRQSHTDEVRALRESHQRELEARERAHDRELRSLGQANTMIMDAGKQGNEARVDALKMQISSLTQQLAEKSAEVAALREKKDKSIAEVVGELASTKEALEALGGGGNEEETPMFERILTGVMDSPLAKAIAHRVEQAPSQPTPPAQQQVVRRVVRRQPAQQQTVQQPVQQPAQQAQTVSPEAQATMDAALAGQPAPEPKKKPEPPRFTQVEMSIAIQFMENAVNSGQKPEDFAASVQSMVPGNVVHYIREAGIDEFIKLAKVPDGSPLMSQGGRNFMRKVAKILVGE
jgi:hypothetical protein